MHRRAFLATVGMGFGILLPWQTYARERKLWRPDGAGRRARIGVVTPHFDSVPESEFWSLAPEGVSVHASRVVYADVKEFANAPLVDDAAHLLAAIPVDNVVVAFTTSSYLLGVDAEQAFRDRVQKRVNGIPVVLPAMAAAAALRALNTRALALIHPPWFSDATNEAGVKYFRSLEFDVISASPVRPSRKFAEVDPSELYQWVRTHVPAKADAVFIGGNGLRAIGVVSALEKDLKRPVLTANQVSFWAALRLAKVHDSIPGYGQIFNKRSAA